MLATSKLADAEEENHNNDEYCEIDPKHSAVDFSFNNPMKNNEKFFKGNVWKSWWINAGVGMQKVADAIKDTIHGDGDGDDDDDGDDGDGNIVEGSLI